MFEAAKQPVTSSTGCLVPLVPKWRRVGDAWRVSITLPCLETSTPPQYIDHIWFGSTPVISASPGSLTAGTVGLMAPSRDRSYARLTM